MTNAVDSAKYFILSVERTGNEQWGPRCVWWRPGGMGYTALIEEAGRFTRDEAMAKHDPPHHLAVPCSVVWVPSSIAKALGRKAIARQRGAA